MPLVEDIQGLTPGSLLELFIIDTGELGGGILRFCAGVNQLKTAVVWQGVTYSPQPIQVSGYEESGGGKLPAPIMAVANVDGVIGALCRDLDDLVGSKVTRKRTLVKYLDAVNFPGGVNANADPTQRFSDDVFYIDRRTREDGPVVEFELRAPMDCPNFKAGRPIIGNYCSSWQYRGEGCGYAGGAVAKADDTPTSDITLDDCSHTRAGCKLRNWPNNVLPFGGFPATSLLK